MQLMDTVIMLNAEKCEKVHKALDVAFSLPRWVLNARDQWPTAHAHLTGPQTAKSRLLHNYSNLRQKWDDFLQ